MCLNLFGKQGKAGLKIVDAKFPCRKVLQAGMDGAQDAADAAFLCLDLPELPGEHDDISIVFEDEAERDKLAACLPAPVKGGSRLIPRDEGVEGVSGIHDGGAFKDQNKKGFKRLFIRSHEIYPLNLIS
ncbi:hypothetical protein QC762_0029310 [Podospora pseudocomata]|uniref:DUF7614 domain-containing protein n=1 Tax=Podospora pseudocomata TaxID=2093779 RepID=A0ABR0GS57_9PEZI|nr:hypothetical protein QC762_0029310 [Podospora pseudocomata]